MIPATQKPQLVAALEQLEPNDHLCALYDSQQEQLAVTIPFLRIGLERGEKCIYIGDDTIGDVCEALQADRVDVDGALSSDALVFATKEQTYLKHESFDPDWMFTFWAKATELALSEGFSALRGTGETEWVLRGGPGLERWMEYESRLTHMFAEPNCFALCQYNRRLFPPEFILDLIRTHPIVIYGSTVCRNFYYVPPDEFLGTHQAAREVDRLLTNIRDRQQIERAVEEQQNKLRRAQEILVEDIEQRKRAESLLSAEKHTLQMIAQGDVLFDVLNDLCAGIDEQSPGLMSMVSLIEPDGYHLRPIAGPRVPDDWRRTITPIPIGPHSGSCGTAAFRKQTVVVTDIASDPLWAESRDVAMNSGLRACWSAPLISMTGDLLGTLAMCFPEARSPAETDLALLDRAGHVARIAIERDLIRRALRDSEQRFRLMVEGVKDYAIFMLDAEGRVTSWNEGAERIKGYREEEIIGKHFSQFYLREEVAEGKPAAALAWAATAGRIEQEGWSVRKDGTRFWADSVMTAIQDEKGELIGFVNERKRSCGAVKPISMKGNDSAIQAVGLGTLPPGNSSGPRNTSASWVSIRRARSHRVQPLCDGFTRRIAHPWNKSLTKRSMKKPILNRSVESCVRTEPSGTSIALPVLFSTVPAI
jgi:PAS domain S-box-containing protein